MPNYNQPQDAEKRLRYFTGQFLQDQDFIDEQSYHIDRERRHARLFLSPGIAQGLEVSAPAADRVQVEPGTALDGSGRQIVLALPTPVDLSNHKSTSVTLLIYWRQVESDVATSGSAANTRWLEQPGFEIAPAGQQPSNQPAVTLAGLEIDANGLVTIRTDNRVYAGLRPPGGPILRASAAGRLVLSGDASLTGSLSVGGATDLAGAARMRGGLTVDGLGMFNGAVGIGTIEPQGKLDVRGAIHAGGSAIYFTETNHNHTGFGNTTGFAAIENSADIDALTIFGRTGTSQKRTVKLWDFLQVNGDLVVTENVGIGTGSPGAKLEVAGGGGTNVDLIVNGRLRSNNNNGGLWVASDRFVGGHSTNQVGFWNNGWHLTVQSDGKVGIGTISPDQKLAIAGGGGASDIGIRLTEGGTGKYWQMRFRHDSDGDLTFSNNAIGEAGGVLHLDRETGNVGIGTIEPHGKLDVRGTIHAEGHLTVDGYVGIGTRTLRAKLHVLADVAGTAGLFEADGVGNDETMFGVIGIASGKGSKTAGQFSAICEGHDEACGVFSHGYNNGTGTTYGIYGVASGSGTGTKYGVFSEASGNGTKYAGYFVGNVHVTGDMTESTVSILIDHPLDPLNKTLRHNLIESPENLCLYRGKVKLDAAGTASVELPAYFAALTKEEEATAFIAAIGKQPFPTSYEWSQQYTMLTIHGQPDAEVAYMVLADRDDPVIHQLGRPVEETKGDGNFEKDTLLYPEAYGHPQEMGVHFRVAPAGAPGLADAPARIEPLRIAPFSEAFARPGPPVEPARVEPVDPQISPASGPADQDRPERGRGKGRKRTNQ